MESSQWIMEPVCEGRISWHDRERHSTSTSKGEENGENGYASVNGDDGGGGADADCSWEEGDGADDSNYLRRTWKVRINGSLHS